MAMTEAGTFGHTPADPPGSDDERQLVMALRTGDEQAFETLIERYHASMVRLAGMYVPNRQVAEEVAQEAWMGVLNGIQRFEARSSLKTWIFRILTNRAKTRGERESRTIPFSAFFNPDQEQGEPAVEPERFGPISDHRPGHWGPDRPDDWAEIPEERLVSAETRAHILAGIETLPPSQREVITLRDIDGWTSEEVCALLQISDANQRVLLHRARSKVRRVLEVYLRGE